MKRKEIKWRREGRGTMAGRQDGIIFRIFHPWDAPERGHTVSCYDTRGTGREISTAGYREFTWEEAVEFCQKIAAGEIDLEDLQAQFDAEDMAKEREAVRKTTEKAKRLAAMLEGYGMKYTDLLDHSLNVYHRLRAIVCVETYGTTTSDLLAEDVEETVAVLALLHDVCKVNCYHTETRRRKNPETGYWEDYQTYAFRDPIPLGHGEKSLYLIQRHMDLEPEEAMAIRWHMGAYDNAVKGDGRALSAAMEATPWVWRLHQADMCAAWVDEREAEEE